MCCGGFECDDWCPAFAMRYGRVVYLLTGGVENSGDGSVVVRMWAEERWREVVVVVG